MGNENTLVLGPIRSTQSWWRRQILFQSMDQLRTYLLALCIVLFVAVLVFRMAGTPIKLEDVLCAVAGSLSAPFLAQPCIFSITGEGAARVIAQLDARLTRRSYVCERDGADGVLVYRSRLPRWLNWKENVIQISRQTGTVTVTGPRSAMWLLHKTAAAAVRELN